MEDKNKNEVVKKRQLTSQEKEVIQKIKERGPAKGKGIFAVSDTDEGNKSASPFSRDETLSLQDKLDEYQARIFEATGCINQYVGIHCITKAGEALTPTGADMKKTVEVANYIAQATASMSPNDEIEGQLVSQLVVLHEQAMNWLGRALRTERVDFANTYLNGASKLLTRHHETLASLLKYRRGGEQRVHVEHVHVHDGGRAIVGNVGTGGGLNQKNEEGPHAKV